MKFYQVERFVTGDDKELQILGAFIECECNNLFFVPCIDINVVSNDAAFIPCTNCNNVGKLTLAFEE